MKKAVKEKTRYREDRRVGDAKCAVFGKCGGCDLLDIAYSEQLSEKQRRIIQLFSELISEDKIAQIIGMDHPYHYRDKVSTPFVAGKGKTRGRLLTGMYERGTHRVIEAPGGCILENEQAHSIIEVIKSIMKRHDIPPYDEDTGKGFLRHVQIRFAHNTDEVLVTLVTNSDDFPHSRSFCKELRRRCPQITSIVQNVNTRDTNVILGDEEHTLYGPGFILDKLCDASFRLSSSSFYQVNSKQTEVLYSKAMELAGLEGLSCGGDAAASRDDLPKDERPAVLDAYCGTGTIGVIAAKAGAGKVVGVDNVASAIRDARQNAKHNGIEAEYYCDDATEFISNMGPGEIDILFMDPPRAGSTQEFLQAIASAEIPKVVYISCNPETQARDVRQLIEYGYHIDAMQPVDMFPHTEHIENIAVLSR